MTTIPPIPPVLIEDLGYILPKPTSVKARRYGMYECECGNIFKARTDSIKCKAIQSCGCYHSKVASVTHKTHGLTHHPVYSSWENMLQRVTNTKAAGYAYYGGNDIVICERWLDVSNFIEDMYSTWSEGLSIDRIDPTGDYEPSNCRWATKTTQARNTKLIHNHNTSGYRGVSWDKRRCIWRAYIRHEGKQKHLGYFDTPLEAAIAYDTYVTGNNLEHTTNRVLL